MSVTASDPVGSGHRSGPDRSSSHHGAPGAIATDEKLGRWIVGAVRIVMGILWLTNAGWKTPPDFGRPAARGLFRFTSYAVEHEVFAPFAFVVREIVLPNFTLFGWWVLLIEAGLGAFLLLGLGTRGWALVGAAHTTIITLSTLNAPGEWNWGYYMFIAIHLLLFATAAGRYAGFDGLLRPAWMESGGRFARLMMRLS
jgi:thiosulfate dehydrogenase [quinone] large subunit